MSGQTGNGIMEVPPRRCRTSTWRALAAFAARGVFFPIAVFFLVLAATLLVIRALLQH